MTELPAIPALRQHRSTADNCGWHRNGIQSEKNYLNKCSAWASLWTHVADHSRRLTATIKTKNVYMFTLSATSIISHSLVFWSTQPTTNNLTTMFEVSMQRGPANQREWGTIGETAWASSFWWPHFSALLACMLTGLAIPLKDPAYMHADYSLALPLKGPAYMYTTVLWSRHENKTLGEKSNML